MPPGISNSSAMTTAPASLMYLSTYSNMSLLSFIHMLMRLWSHVPLE